MVAAISLAAVVAALAACGTAVSSPTGPVETPTPSVPASLRDLQSVKLVVGGTPMRVAVAETPAEWSVGLQNLTSLGPLDGMLFAFPAPTQTKFWMKSTLIPLDIGFFDAEGRLVEVDRMTPCTADPCATYGPTASYRWAVEVPAGRFAGLAPGTTLTFPADYSPAASPS